MDFSIIISRLVSPFVSWLGNILLILSIVVLSFIAYVFIKYNINPFRVTKQKLYKMRIRLKPVNFVRWKIIDFMNLPSMKNVFMEYGLTLYCGRQGSGKTISMVYYLANMKRRYPECVIVTNFNCKYSDHTMESWEDFFKYRNGEKGVIFAIDEIHNEYSSMSWKDFPETLLSEISQQRKQRIKIIASSQVYTRVVKAIREQSRTVVVCSTLLGRWTFCREYDAVDFQAFCDNPGRKIKSIRRYSFVQSDLFRENYDTYEKINRMRDTKYIPRNER